MRKSFSKAVSIVLFMTMLLSTFSFVTLTASAAAKLKTENGYLFVEAEKIRGYNSDYYQEESSLKYFSGRKGLRTIKAHMDAVDAATEPCIDLSFKADVTGTYTIWMRSTANQDGSAANSVYMSVGTGNGYAYTKIAGMVDIPQWGKIGTVFASEGTEQSVRLHPRQGGSSIMLDCFVITCGTEEPTDEALGIKSAPTPEPTPTPPPYEVNPTMLKDGFALVEVEDLYYDKNEYTVDKFEDSSGSVLLPKVEDKNAPANDAHPHLDLSFTADKDGRYAVWLRLTCNTINSGGNSIFLAQNDSAYSYYGLLGEIDELGWFKITTKSVKAGETCKIYIRNRQKNSIRFDMVMISDDFTYTPTGKNPKPDGTYKMELPADKYPMPTILPPAGEHPRLLFRESDIPTIKANFEKEENAAAYKALQKLVENPTNGILQPNAAMGYSNYDAKPLDNITALAFDYAINGNKDSGRKAYDAIMNYYNTVEYYNETDISTYRYRGNFIFTVAEVYDWCYDLLTPQERTELVKAAEIIALELDMKYPPTGQGSVSGHGGEPNLLRDLLSLGIAAYDERPDIYNFVAGRLLSEYIEPRNFWYQSHSHHQGNAYGEYRGQWEVWCAWIFKRMAGVDVFSADQQYFPYEALYSRRPDGQYLRDGDDYNEAGISGYWTSWGTINMMLASYFNDPYLKNEMIRQGVIPSENSTSPTHFLIFNNPDVRPRVRTELPLTHWFAAPKGMMIARTGWNDGVTAPDVLATFEINEHNAANHMHLQNGHFQIYYKGILTGDSGRYDDGYATHRENYSRHSVAHNTISVYDGTDNGGQRKPNGGAEAGNMEIWMDESKGYHVGEVLDHEYGPDPIEPEYTYLKGDITAAYTQKVDEMLRSFLFMPTGDSEHPAVFFVMDKVDTSNKAFKKAFLLHMQQEPTVNGNRTIIENTAKNYNGRLVVDTLLPKPENTVIEKLGGEGKEFLVNGTNWACKVPTVGPNTQIEGQGWGRIEISPKAESEVDYMLHVMSVSDAGGVVEDLDSKLIEGNGIVGGVIADRVGIFAKDKERLSDNVKFTIPGEGNFKVAVCGIKEGTWSVNGEKEVIVTEEGGIAYFDASAGNVALTYVNENSEREPVDATLPTHGEYIGVKVNSHYLYSDSPATIVNGRTLVPMRAIFERLDCTIEWDGETSTVTGIKSDLLGETTVKLTLDDTTAYVNGNPITLDSPATLINDRTMVPVRFIAESLGATVGWDAISKTVSISAPEALVAKDWSDEYENFIPVFSAVQSGDDGAGNIINYSLDGDYESRWAVSGNDGSAWGEYDLGKTYSLDKMLLAYYNGSKRIYTFTIAVSEDGENYTTVLDKQTTSGKSERLEEYDLGGVNARYIKFIGGGSSANLWNSMTEIIFLEKK